LRNPRQIALRKQLARRQRGVYLCSKDVSSHKIGKAVSAWKNHQSHFDQVAFSMLHFAVCRTIWKQQAAEKTRNERFSTRS
jgi:hypothetical protein